MMMMTEEDDNTTGRTDFSKDECKQCNPSISQNLAHDKTDWMMGEIAVHGTCWTLTRENSCTIQPCSERGNFSSVPRRTFGVSRKIVQGFVSIGQLEHYCTADFALMPKSMPSNFENSSELKQQQRGHSKIRDDLVISSILLEEMIYRLLRNTINPFES